MVNNDNLNVREKIKITRRKLIFGGLLSVPFFGLFANLWNLQISKKNYYQELSRGNRIRLINTAAPRGFIYDRNLIVYAKNKPVFNLTITLEDCPDIDRVIQKLSTILLLDTDRMQERIKQNKSARFVPITIAQDISWKQLSVVLSYQEEFAGININYNPIREYPFGKEASHILGYMHRINEQQIKLIHKDRIESAEILGQSGLEFYFNHYLIGYDGGRQVEVDSSGREIQILKRKEPIPGNSIQLAIDQNLQEFTEEILKGKKGGVIVSDPNTGEILTLVSSPQFDPNIFSKGLDQSKWNKIVKSEDQILTNRVTQGLYSPGSTLKMLIALCALELGIIDKDFVHHCKGFHKQGRSTFHCWKRGGHGDITLVDAISQSCNTFFYSLGVKIGIHNITHYAKKFGFGALSQIALNGENQGVFPSPEWKLKRFRQIWYPGDTINLSIGQGFVSATPIQMLVYLNRIINDGRDVPLTLVKSMIKPKNANIQQANAIKSFFDQQKNPVRNRLSLSKTNLDLIKSGMKGCIQDQKGTAHFAHIPSLSLAGKTGSTQVVSNKTKKKYIEERGQLDPSLEDHGWFVGYAPFENPKVSISILVENGKSGGRTALIARDILAYYLA